jgi:orotate phosphoribosyltransferase
MDITEKLKKHNIININQTPLKLEKKINTHFNFVSLISYPKLLKDITNLLIKKTKNKNELVACVSTNIIPLATCYSQILEIPMILINNKQIDNKNYQTISGRFSFKQKIIIIENVITTGKNIKNIIKKLELEGLIINEIICILDKQEGGTEELSKKYQITSLFKSSDFINKHKSQFITNKKNITQNIYTKYNKSFLKEIQDSSLFIQMAEKYLKRHQYTKASIEYNKAAKTLKPITTYHISIQILYNAYLQKFHRLEKFKKFQQLKKFEKNNIIIYKKKNPSQTHIKNEIENQYKSLIQMEQKITHLPKSKPDNDNDNDNDNDYYMVQCPRENQIQSLKDIIRKLAAENDELKLIEKFEGAIAFRNEFTSKFKRLRKIMSEFRRKFY